MDDVPLKALDNSPGYCPLVKEKTTLLGSDKMTVAIFKDFLRKAPPLTKLEKLVTWSLFQMNIRPDLATPSSRFQILTNTKKGIQYWDFKDSALEMDIPKGSPPMTFIYGLETLLRTYGSKQSLRSLAWQLDTHLPLKVPVSADFAGFIDKHKKTLIQNPIFRKAFFKADEQIRYGESLPKLSYTKLIKKYYQFKSRVEVELSTSNELFSYDLPGEKNKSALCNVDIQEYSKSNYNISSLTFDRNHPFGLKFSDGQFFLGVTSITTVNFRPLLNTFLVETTQGPTSASLCYIPSDKGPTAYISFKGRDPAQHLFNLFQYKIHGSSSAEELDQFIKYPRHIILKNPIRILYESDRASDKDLGRFIRQDIPVYHSQSLGEVWLYSPKSGFVVDKRGKAFLSCMK